MLLGIYTPPDKREIESSKWHGLMGDPSINPSGKKKGNGRIKNAEWNT